MQTAELGMFTQPQCFPQGEDASRHCSRGERSKQLVLYPPGTVTVMFESFEVNKFLWLGKNSPVKWLILLVIRSPFN